MTTPTPPAATTALGAAAAEPVESTVAPVDPKASTAPVAAAPVDAKADATETPEQKAAAEKATAEKTALEAASQPFTDVAQLKLAEGVTVDEVAMKEFLPIAKELGLTAKQAQALVEFSAKTGGAAEAARVERNAAADKAAVTALKADKEIGGAKYEASMALAGKAIRNVLGTEFGEWATSLQLADGTLLGNRVEFARALVKLGASVSEDSKSGTHSQGAGKDKALHELMYGPGTVQAGPTS